VLARIGICVASVVAASATVLVPIGVYGDGVAAAAVRRVDPPTMTARGVGQPSPPAPDATASVQAVQVRSSYETATRVIYRDIGLSVALPDGHDLWLFGDTNVWQHQSGHWTSKHFIDGSSALEARYTRGQVPHGGEYPTGTPAQFIPSPRNVYMPDGSGRLCVRGIGDAAFAARWPTGAAVMPTDTSDVLITYSVVCVTSPPGGPQQQAEGWGYALYNWRTRHFDHGPTDVFKPPTSGALFPTSDTFGSPVFADGNVTLFSSTCTAQYLGCGGGQVSSVSVPATTAALDNPSSYQLNQLSTDGSASWAPLSISVGRYASGLRLIEWTTIGGTYEIFSAASVATPWHLDTAGTLPGCETHTGFCFALEGHPELSTPSQIFVSYVDPNSGPLGHVVVSAVPD